MIKAVLLLLAKFKGSSWLYEILSNTSNTRKRVSSDIRTLRSRLKKKKGGAEFFKRLRGFWISDETQLRMFDMASQMINNSWRNSSLKLAKFYGNWEHISKPRSQ